MKKVLLGILSACMLAGCAAKTNTYTEVTITNPVNIEVYDEHPDLSTYIYLDDENPCYKEITMEESLRLFEEGGSGILVFSSDNCAWCERAIPELNYVAKKMGVSVYFVNPYAPYNFPDNKERHDVFATLCKYLEPIMEKDDNGEPCFFIPEVVGIKDGTIVGNHLSLVENVESDENGPVLTEKQVNELRGEYKKVIEAVAD